MVGPESRGGLLGALVALEADGVITGYVVTVDPSALGRSFEVLINADLVAKDLHTVERFEARFAAMVEIVELRRMFGLPPISSGCS